MERKDESIAISNLIEVAGYQYSSQPSIIALRDGGFAVFWVDQWIEGGDNPDPNAVLLCRLFDSTGTPRGPARPVSTGSEYASPSYGRCAVECADTAFNVFWQGRLPPGSSRYRILATRFDPADGYTTPIVAIDTPGELAAYTPRVAPVGDASMVIWHTYHDSTKRRSGRGRVLNSALVPISAEFSPYSIDAKAQSGFTIVNAAVSDKAVVAWTSTDSFDGPGSGHIFAQQFDGRGKTVGDLVEVRGLGPSPHDPGNGKAMAVRKTGGFHAFYFERPQTIYARLYGCVFDEDGIQLGNTVEIAQAPQGATILGADAVPAPRNSVAVFWTSQRFSSQGYSSEIWMRLVSDLSGAPKGQQVQVSPADNFSHRYASAALLKSGSIAVAWQRKSAVGEEYSIIATLVTI